MTDPRDANARNLTEFFARHLIGLCWFEGPAGETGNFTAKPVFRCASGFLLELGGERLLITAGHVLSELPARLAENGHIARRHTLFDLWSPRCDVPIPIPCDFTSAPADVIDDPEIGVDVAAIRLSRFYLDLLTPTIEPIRRVQWEHQEGLHFDRYAIVGIPAEVAVLELRENRLSVHPQPRVVFVDESAPVESSDADTPCPQFFGRIRDDESIGDIGGTSGGLIVGFRRDEHGDVRYWPVAIQSRWRRSLRTITGTSLPHFARVLERWRAIRAAEPPDSRERE